MGRAHSTVSKSYLDYLLLPGEPSTATYDYAFLTYAASNWSLHYTAQDPVFAEQYRTDARKLCKVTTGLFDCSKCLGLKQVVQALLDEGTDIKGQDDEHGTALQVASERGHGKVVQLLLERGADAELRGRHYGNALYNDSLAEYEEIVQMLVDNGANVYAQTGLQGSTLQAASFERHDKIVHILLEKGDATLSLEVFLTRPKDDEVVERLFLQLMRRRGWHNLQRRPRGKCLATRLQEVGFRAPG
ncbi:ankyrin repeat domain-containing protein [Aspergillus alliaceus]|uniref:ankyrin repeat domain-containing protein n=1 Tax=Petromyces alliaceus TaxID=209559 RepID=UPI0012A5ECB5|nr:ankyrin repeat-containing domain protein [Aspergillus alliaceus]KAB8239037.1 ankyrin repeat-containing domain protein [Aspergillus alliaceus]